MAIHRDYAGREELNPGRWYPFQEDPDTKKIAMVRFRALSRDLAKKLTKKYERPRKVKVKDKLVSRVEVYGDNVVEMFKEGMDYCWMDVKDYEVGVHSEEQCALFMKELGNGDLALDKDVCLDGKLTHAIRTWCLENVPGFMEFMRKLFIMPGQHMEPGKGITDDDFEANIEDGLRQNLSNGSSSSPSTEQPRGTSENVSAAESTVGATSPAFPTDG